MDFDAEEGFPGLYNAESGRRSNESDYSDGDHEKPSKKDLLIGRRKDKKDSKKDKGYAALAGDSSPEEDAETKSPSKTKKTKAFKFPSKSKEKREKSRDKEKVGEKDVKEKEKEKEMLEREKKKEKLRKEKEKREKEKEEKIKVKELKEKGKDKEKDKGKEKDKEKVKEKDKDKKDRKSSKTQPTIAAGVPFEEIFTLGVAQPIFGVSLGLAVERSRCHDDTNLPLVIRDCIDYLQENGVHSEAIYRVEPAKQRVLTLRKLYNDREPVAEKDYEIPTACALLKLFITELPEPVLTTELCSLFEDASTGPATALVPLIAQLPTCHRSLLAWLMTHLASVMANEKINRLNVQTIGTLLGPTLNMSSNLLILFIYNTKILFPDTKLTKYVPPLTSLAPVLPESTDEITKELRKQESLLSQIHAEMHAGFVTQKREEQLWEGQRIVTQLKRKLRSVQKSTDPSCSSQNHSSLDERQTTQDEDQTDKPLRSETSSVGLHSSSEERIQPPPKQAEKLVDKTVTVVVEPKVVSFPVEKLQVKVEPKVVFPVESFEDNFENYQETGDPPSTNNKEMTESIYSINSETFVTKIEKPKLSKEELQLMRLQLEHAEYLHLKSILQAKINSERFEIVKLRSHLAIKNKQENNANQNNNVREASVIAYSEAEIEEKQRLVKENALLEQKRLSLAHQIFQERTACIEHRIQLAMNEIL